MLAHNLEKTSEEAYCEIYQEDLYSHRMRLFSRCCSECARGCACLTGTVRSIDSASKTISIFTDNGSEGLFKELTNPRVKIDFDKKLRADASTVDTFKDKGKYVIVYYFGDGSVRTAVALRELGSGPFTDNLGTVVNLDGREHLLFIKNKSGLVKPFKIASDTVADTDIGVINGFKFQPQKDDQVRVVAAMVNGTPTALFVRTM